MGSGTCLPPRFVYGSIAVVAVVVATFFSTEGLLSSLPPPVNPTVLDAATTESQLPNTTDSVQDGPPDRLTRRLRSGRNASSAKAAAWSLLRQHELLTFATLPSAPFYSHSSQRLLIDEVVEEEELRDQKKRAVNSSTTACPTRSWRSRIPPQTMAVPRKAMRSTIYSNLCYDDIPVYFFSGYDVQPSQCPDWMEASQHFLSQTALLLQRGSSVSRLQAWASAKEECLDYCLMSSCCVGFVVVEGQDGFPVLANCSLRVCDFSQVQKKLRHVTPDGRRKRFGSRIVGRDGTVRVIVRREGPLYTSIAGALVFHLQYPREYRPTLVPRRGAYATFLRAPPLIVHPASARLRNSPPPKGPARKGVPANLGGESVVERPLALSDSFFDVLWTVEIALRARDGTRLEAEGVTVAGTLEVALPPAAGRRSSSLLLWEDQTTLYKGRALFWHAAPSGSEASRVLMPLLATHGKLNLSFAFVLVSAHSGPLGLSLPPAARKLTRSVTLSRIPNFVAVERDRQLAWDPSAKCAPLLRDDEGCLFNFSVALQHFDNASGTFVPAVSEELERLMVRLRLVNESDEETALAEREPALCVASSGRVISLQIVDGNIAHIVAGVARFGHLVVRVSAANRTTAEALKEPPRKLRLRAELLFGALTPRVESCPTASPGTIVLDADELEPFLQQRSDSPAHRTGKATNEGLPILVSLPVHECAQCIESQLRNMKHYLWPSIIVLHVAPSFVTFDPGNATRSLNASHPFVIINPSRIATLSGLHVLFTHLHNLRYVLHSLPHLGWSHVLFCASNEMFVRHGAVDYIRSHDAVWMAPPEQDAGFVYQQFLDRSHGFNAFTFKYTEEMSTDIQFSKNWPFAPDDLLLRDRALANLMQRASCDRYPTSVVFMEGSFFLRSIVNELLQKTNLITTKWCEDPIPYPTSEVYIAALMPDLCSRYKCGYRISTMVWRRENPPWTATVEDVLSVACSPFAVPFALKRIPRRLDNAVRKYIQQLEQEEPSTRRTCL